MAMASWKCEGEGVRRRGWGLDLRGIGWLMVDFGFFGFCLLLEGLAGE